MKESGLFLFLTLVNSNCAHSMPPSFPVMAQHWLLGQQVISNYTGMECFLFACNLDLFVMFEVPIHLMFVIDVKGTCRTCIVIEAQAWIKLSTMPVSKNTRYTLALTFGWFCWDIFSDYTLTSSRSWHSCCSDCCTSLPDSSKQRLPEDEGISHQNTLHWLTVAHQLRKSNRKSHKVISFLTQQFLMLNS